jgi:hypothetical protein
MMKTMPGGGNAYARMSSLKTEKAKYGKEMKKKKAKKKNKKDK